MQNLSKQKQTILISVLLFFVSGLALLASASITSDLTNLRSHSKVFAKAYDIIKIQDAWEKIRSSNTQLSATKIGIIDSGVDIQHQEFAGELINTVIIGAVNFGDTSPSAKKDNHTNGHGTQVAGIIGANNLSGLGVVLPVDSPQVNGLLSGVSSLNYVLEMRRLGDGFFASRMPLFDFFIKVNSIHRSGGRIINFSQSWVKSSALTEEQRQFVEGQVGLATFIKNSLALRLVISRFSDTLFIVSAGNENIDAENETPADIELNNLIAVAATNLNDKKTNFSSFGSNVDLSAPGIGVYAPKPGSGYDTNFSGTSASAPMVTGVAGLIKAIKPELTPAQIKLILTKTENTDPVITDPDKPIGRRLNALKAVCDPLVGLNCAPTPPPQPSNTWQSVGPMTAERAEHTSTLLNDGRVLITGGFKGAGFTFSELSSAEIFNPNTNAFLSIGDMTTPRAFHTATLLNNGKVLILGSKLFNQPNGQAAEIFDPINNSFVEVGPMLIFGIARNSSVLLNNGKVLFIGSASKSQLFDTSTNSFQLSGDLNISRLTRHRLTLLQDGRALLTGGQLSLFGFVTTNGAEVFKP